MRASRWEFHAMLDSVDVSQNEAEAQPCETQFRHARYEGAPA
jgi:hypothetical protein